MTRGWITVKRDLGIHFGIYMDCKEGWTSTLGQEVEGQRNSVKMCVGRRDKCSGQVSGSAGIYSLARDGWSESMQTAPVTTRSQQRLSQTCLAKNDPQTGVTTMAG